MTHQSTIIIKRPDHLGGGNWLLENLTSINVLFGKNGSGKSELLRRVKDEDPISCHYVPPERAGEISHDLNLMQEGLDPVKIGNKRKSNLSPTHRQESISRIQSVLMKFGSVRGRKNTAKEPSIFIETIEDTIQTLLPNFKFEITDGTPPYRMTRTSNDQPVSSVNALSSGEAEMLTLALDIITVCVLWELNEQPKRTLLIDEPDTHLHPDLQQHLGEFLVSISELYKVQLIIATHSTTLLSALGYHGGNKTSVIYLNNASEKQNAIKFEKSLQELSACLGGHALMGPLFSAPLLLVEGDDDYRVWSHVPRHHKVNIAVIPCGGDEIFKYQKTLEKVFASIRGDQSKPVGFALLDSDKDIPEGVDDANIKFIKLQAHEIENLYLSDAVLNLFGLSWDEAKLKLKNPPDVFPEAITERLNDCDNWDRKKVDLKGIITPISEILDEKKHQWTWRIASVLGKADEGADVFQYLGTEAYEALFKR